MVAGQSIPILPMTRGRGGTADVEMGYATLHAASPVRFRRRGRLAVVFAACLAVACVLAVLAAGSTSSSLSSSLSAHQQRLNDLIAKVQELRAAISSKTSEASQALAAVTRDTAMTEATAKQADEENLKATSAESARVLTIRRIEVLNVSIAVDTKELGRLERRVKHVQAVAAAREAARARLQVPVERETEVVAELKAVLKKKEMELAEAETGFSHMADSTVADEMKAKLSKEIASQKAAQAQLVAAEQKTTDLQAKVDKIPPVDAGYVTGTTHRDRVEAARLRVKLKAERADIVQATKSLPGLSAQAKHMLSNAALLKKLAFNQKKEVDKEILAEKRARESKRVLEAELASTEREEKSAAAVVAAESPTTAPEHTHAAKTVGHDAVDRAAGLYGAGGDPNDPEAAESVYRRQLEEDEASEAQDVSNEVDSSELGSGDIRHYWQRQDASDVGDRAAASQGAGSRELDMRPNGPGLEDGRLADAQVGVGAGSGGALAVVAPRNNGFGGLRQGPGDGRV